MYTIHEMYDLEHTLAKDYLEQFKYPWEALKGIKDMIIALGPPWTLKNIRKYPNMSGSIRQPRYFLPHISAHPVSSALTPKYVTAHSSADLRLSVQTALSATPVS